MSIIRDQTGRRFGKLVVIELVTPLGTNYKKVRWTCKCDCGVTKSVPHGSLTSGGSRSCGCLQKEKASKTMRTHGLAKSAEYLAWANMLGRCSPKSRGRADYFDRGITVCTEWQRSAGAFERFIAYVGMRPSNKHSLDRINNDEGYKPGNVRWATRNEQTNNRRRVLRIDQYTNEEIVEECKRRGLR